MTNNLDQGKDKNYSQEQSELWLKNLDSRASKWRKWQKCRFREIRKHDV